MAAYSCVTVYLIYVTLPKQTYIKPEILYFSGTRILAASSQYCMTLNKICLKSNLHSEHFFFISTTQVCIGGWGPFLNTPLWALAVCGDRVSGTCPCPVLKLSDDNKYNNIS